MAIYKDYLGPEILATTFESFKSILKKYKYTLTDPSFKMIDVTRRENGSGNFYFQFKAKNPHYSPELIGFACVGMSGWPSNCGVCIWHEAFFGTGYFVQMPKEMKLEIINLFIDLVKLMNYSQIHYSAKTSGQAELISLLTDAGFKVVQEMSFRNRRSGNNLSYLICNI